MTRERRGTPIQIDDFTITPVAEVRLDMTRLRRGVYVRGSVKPVAVLLKRNGKEERIEIR